MKMKDVKPPPNHGGGVYGDATVGDLLEFLSQFPKDMPLVMRAYSDACREEGYPFFYARPSPYPFSLEEQPSLGDDERELEVKSVHIVVDH